MSGTEYPYVNQNNIAKISVGLHWYKNHGSDIVGEEIIDGVTLHDLQDIFDVYMNTCLFNCWQVNAKHARLLKRLIKHKILIKKYTYFVVQEGYVV